MVRLISASSRGCWSCASLLLVIGCARVPASTSPDLAVSLDMAVSLDFSASADMTSRADMTTKLDLAARPDLAVGADMSLDVHCDDKGCLSATQLLQNIIAKLDGNVTGYEVYVGGQSHAGGFARSATDAPPSGLPMATALVTNIASVSKLLTTVAVLQSTTNHAISLDTPITSYLPASWTPGANISQMTFRRLLTHTAGIRANCNGDLTDYATLQSIIQSGVNTSDVGVASYNNCNFAMFRELLANMEGQRWQSGGSTDEPTWNANFYVNYVNENVFTPVGISTRFCYPTSGNSIYSYPYPAGTTNGIEWDGWTNLNCGAGGWYLSLDDLHLISSDLATGTKLLTAAQKTSMSFSESRANASGFGGLGWDNTVRTDCPNPSDCKNGHLSDGSGRDIWTYMGVLKCDVPVVVAVNSPLPSPYETGEDIIGVVTDSANGAALNGVAHCCDFRPLCNGICCDANQSCNAGTCQ